MVTIHLPEDLAQQLESIARREKRPVEDVLASMITHYEPQAETNPNWDMILGIGEETVTDMSTTVRETLQQYFQDKYGSVD